MSKGDFAAALCFLLVFALYGLFIWSVLRG